MKIVLLTQYFHPETGAPQNRLLELTKEFKQLGWEVLVITALPNYPKGKIFSDYKGKFKTEESIEGIRAMRYWLSASNSPKSLPRILSMLSFSFTSLFSKSEIKKFNPDFFFVESPPLTLAFTAYILSKSAHSKLIMNVSDIWPMSAKELGAINDGFVYKKIERLEKFLYEKSFLCTGQSEEIVSHIKNSGAKKVYLFRNGVDTKRFSVRKSTAGSNGNLKIIYAGLLGVAQGVFEIVKCINFAELGAELHIYGDGAERYELENFLKAKNPKNIFLNKSVSRDEIPGLLSRFDCTLIPLVRNIYGAVPSKIYEAMGAGLPVLFSGSGEGAKIISETETGLVSGPKDYKHLAKNILELKNSAELRNKISENCRRSAEEKFDRGRLIKQFSDKLISYLN